MAESVLLTGATGFIGSRLVGRLRRSDYNVTALVHETPPPSADGDRWTDVEHVSGDVTAFESLPDFSGYEAVIHLAGAVSVEASISQPRRYFRLNALGTQHVVERARLDGVERILYLSSASVYGDPVRLPIDETHPLQTQHPYAASKLAGEHVLEAASHAHGLLGASARGFTVYGPDQQSDNLVPEVIRQVNADRQVLELGNLNPTRDFVYVDDVADALFTILEQHEKGYQVYNVGSEEESSVRDVVACIADIMGVDLEVTSSATSRDDDVEIDRMVADCSRLRRLGWSPDHDLYTGMKKTVEGMTHD